jgi:hypothetical protein
VRWIPGSSSHENLKWIHPMPITHWHQYHKTFFFNFIVFLAK